MIRALYSSATGMKAQEIMLDVTANNLANVNTNGFKRSHVDFADLMYSSLREPGAELAVGQPSPVGLEIGSGSRCRFSCCCSGVPSAGEPSAASYRLLLSAGMVRRRNGECRGGSGRRLLGARSLPRGKEHPSARGGPCRRRRRIDAGIRSHSGR